MIDSMTIIQPIIRGYRADGVQLRPVSLIPIRLGELDQHVEHFLRKNPDVVRVEVDLAVSREA